MPLQSSSVSIDAMSNSTKIWAFILGPVLAVLVYFLLPDQFVDTAGKTVEFTHAGKACAAVTTLMATWWFTEALPIAVTAMIPIILFPLLGVAPPVNTMRHYASGTIFLFLGGFLIAAAIHRWHLDRRIALVTINVFGTKPKQMVLGLMFSTALLSAWVSNSATAAMMVPIAVAVMGVIRSTQTSPEITKDERNFAVCVLLSIAYAASIGGMATLVGSPPNGIFARYVADTYGVEVSFLSWMKVALPATLLMLPATYILLTKFLFPIKMEGIPGGRDWIRGELKKLGPMSKGERTVLVVFVLAALTWMFLPVIKSIEIGGMQPFKPVTEELVAMTAGVLLFIIPIDVKRGIHALDWNSAKDVVAWDVLLLFGGGLSMAAAIQSTGLASLIGAQAQIFQGVPELVMMAGASTVVTFVSEVTSNTALAATMMPIVGAACDSLQVNPEGPFFAVVMAASCAFMMPVGTPPNAIVFGTGRLKIGDMVRAGIWLNFIAIFIGVACSYLLGRGLIPMG
ncbi:DASS family sodium-coupled anion symporter [Sutterella sp.]|uniref:SLC13 family permease n=1 Tax=Sutterella sp. TaxID=1981025 RepID=UPI0026E1095C|nr:DASS family sodium-coupled anion symporter [Sutterella sp.]MDO5531808.1 DASS family sodium-coupled anion symporter [Sutterella sp.]